jgi:hypothetical protein
MARSSLKRTIGTALKLLMGFGVIAVALVGVAAHTVLARVTPETVESRLSLACNGIVLGAGFGLQGPKLCGCVTAGVINEFGREGAAALADAAVLLLREEIAGELSAAGRPPNPNSPYTDATTVQIKRLAERLQQSCRLPVR